MDEQLNDTDLSEIELQKQIEEMKAQLEIERMKAEIEALKQVEEPAPESAPAAPAAESAAEPAAAPAPAASPAKPAAKKGAPAKKAARPAAARPPMPRPNDPAYIAMMKAKKAKLNLLTFVCLFLISAVTVVAAVYIVQMKKNNAPAAAGSQQGGPREIIRVETKRVDAQHRAVVKEEDPVLAAATGEKKQKADEFKKDYDALVKLCKEKLTGESTDKNLEQIDEKIEKLRGFISKWDEEFPDHKWIQDARKKLEYQTGQRDFYSM